MSMLKTPGSKYRPVLSFDFPERRWPAKKLTRPPIWMSTDLRDGNQALFEPMSMAASWPGQREAGSGLEDGVRSMRHCRCKPQGRRPRRTTRAAS